MLISDEMINYVNLDPVSGLIDFCNYIIELLKLNEGYNFSEWTVEEHESLLESHTFITVAIESYNIKLDVSLSYEQVSIESDCKYLSGYIINVLNLLYKHKSSNLVSVKKEKYKSMLNGFSYEFTDGDLEKIQSIIDDLRGLINKSSFNDDFKERLLLRLEKLQSELHKKMSNLDKFWGLMGEAGVAIGKFGNDAKPIFDRVQDLLSVAWRSQARAEELESGISHPQLSED